MPEFFFQAHIQSGIDYASVLWDSASDSLQKPLKSLHRWAIKIVLLKQTNLTNKDYKAAQILPLSSRLMSNKAHFVHKIVSGRALIYLSTKLSINQSSRNSSSKLNVPIPRIALFKSSLVYSGPALWNSLPSELRLPVSPSVFKKHLTLHMLSLLGVTCETMIIDIHISPCAAPTCVVLLQAAHTFCVSVLYVHVVYDDKHVLNLVCVRVCMCLPQIKQIFICIYIHLFYFLCSLSTCFSVSISTWFVWLYMYSTYCSSLYP